MATAYNDYTNEWYDDGTTAPSADPWGPGSGWGQDTLSNTNATDYIAPPDAVAKNSEGKWVDVFGKVIDTLTPYATAALTPHITNLQSGGLLKDAQRYVKGAIDTIGNVPNVDLMSYIPHLQRQVQQGLMTPAQAQAALQEASQMQNVQTDQESLTGARTALGQLSDIAQNRGMTEADRAAFASFMNQANANAAQQRAAQIQQLQMQGNAGTGADLAARLSGVQGTANSNAAQGAAMAQAAQARALQAIQAGLTGNQQLNQQLFTQQAQKAQAQDMVNQFNAQARNAINQANANYAQQANLTNFNTANTIAGKNVDIANEQLKMPLSTAQQQYTNQLEKAKAGSTAGIYGGKILADMGNTQANKTGAASGVAPTQPSAAPAPSSGGGSSGGSSGGGVGEILGTVAKAAAPAVVGWLGGLFSDSELKEDKEKLSDDQVDRMLGELTAYKYRFKGNNNPQQVGVMAQDVEKGMPDSVVDTPAGKMIQKPDMMNNVLAIIANQHNRIKNLEGR